MVHMPIANRRDRTHRDGAVPSLRWIVLGAWMLLASTAAAEPPAGDNVVLVRPTPLPFVAGEPLCASALVQRPTALTGLVSWTIETHRHRGRLWSIAVSPDGQRFATGGMDNVIRLWHAASGKLLRMLVGQDYPVYSLSWSPDGKVLAAAGSVDESLRLWDVETGLLLRVFTKFKESVTLVRWSPDGTRLAAAGGASGWIWTWDVASDGSALLTEVGQRVSELDWSPDGTRLAAVIQSTPVSVLDAQTGKSLQTIGDAQGSIYCAKWSPDGTKLAIGDASAAALYAMPQASPLWKRPGISWGAEWAPDNRRLAMIRADGVHIITASDGKTERTLQYGTEALVWRPPDTLVMLHRTSVSRSDPNTGRLLSNRFIAGERPPAWSAGRPIVSGLGTKTLRVWDRATAAKLLVLAGHTAPVRGVAWQIDGDILASAGGDKAIRLWDSKDGKLLHVVKDLPEPALNLAWSPDGKTLASSGPGHAVRLTGAEGQPLGLLDGHTSSVDALAWSHRGDLLASGSNDRAVILWDIGQKKLQRKLPAAGEVRSLAFSPNGSLLACGTTVEVVQLWFVGTGKPVKKNLISLGGDPAVTSLDWLNDGRLLLVGRQSKSLQLWDWLRAEELAELWAHAPIERGEFSPDGSLVIAAAKGRTVYVWRRVEGELQGAIVDQNDHVLLVDAHGNYRLDASAKPDMFFVAQTAEGQLMLTPAEFTARFGWTNHPEAVKFTASRGAAAVAAPAAATTSE